LLLVRNEEKYSKLKLANKMLFEYGRFVESVGKGGPSNILSQALLTHDSLHC
jgi:hypothetical protein